MRSHYCGHVDTSLVGQEISVAGWVHRRRDHGGVIFVDLRDREGILQVVFDPDDAAMFAEAERIRGEAERRLLQSETAVQQALVEKAVAELRKVDAREDMVAKLKAETDRLAAERAVKLAEAPFEQARQEITEVDQVIQKIHAALVAAREEQAGLSDAQRQE